MTQAPALHTARLGSDRAAPRVSVDRLLHPRSVAVFGASDSVDKFGGRIMHFLVRHGFAGTIYPINPRRSAVVGHVAYPSIGDLPAPPDVAILAVPADTLVQSVTEAAAAGVGCCVIISTGFAEAGAEGMARQAALVEVSRATGMRLIGPNCMGLVVPHHRLALCSSVVLDTDRLRDGPRGRRDCRPGGAAAARRGRRASRPRARPARARARSRGRTRCPFRRPRWRGWRRRRAAGVDAGRGSGRHAPCRRGHGQ